MKTDRRILSLFIAIVMCASLLTACGSPDSPDISAPPSESETENPGNASSAFELPAEGESPVFDKIVKNGRLRLGVAVAPPCLLQDPETNEYFGPAVDIVKKVAEACGVETEFVDTTWDVVIAGIQADKYDIIIAPLFATEERLKAVDFVNYTEAGTAYFMRKDHPLADEINSYEDLNNPELTIVTYTGTGNEQEIMRKYPDAQIRSIPQPPGGQPPIEDILAGRGDVGHMDSPLALKLEKSYSDLKVIGGAEESVNAPDVSTPIGMAVAKGNDAFCKFLQSVVDSMADETSESIMKYSLED